MESQVDSDALNTFLTVHRRGGVSNAARALHRSQPAISRRIALLEQELGVPLFERAAGRTRLSDAGRVMVPYAERAVAAAQDAENAVRALTRQNAGPVSLAVVGTLAGGRLSEILKRFACEYQDADLTLRTATSAEVSDLIRRGEATVGLRYDVDRLHDLDHERLATEQLQVVCAPDHPLAEIAWTRVDSLTAQKRLIEAGLGIALLSQSHAADELRSGSIAAIRVGNLAASQDIVAVTRRGGFLSAASQRLLEIVRADYAGTNTAGREAGRPKRARARRRK